MLLHLVFSKGSRHSYRVFGFKPHYFKVNFFQDAWIFFTYFLQTSNVHAIRFQMHYFSLVCIANVCRHSTLTAYRCFRALICCIQQIPQPWKGNWPNCDLICEIEIHRSRKSLFSRKLFSRKSTYIMKRSKNHVILKLCKKYWTDLLWNRLKLILMCLRSALALGS